MPDEENTQPAPEPTQPESTPENSIAESNPIPQSSQEPTSNAPIPPTDSASVEVPPVAPETQPSPEGAILVNNDIPANEPNRSNVTVERHGTDVTITEVMQPTAHSEPATAQMAGNEPLDLAEEIKTREREENLKLANETRQEKKREKIDKILTLFSEKSQIANDEVEKLLHVSDATATRYLEELEKEGKIKQVGETGKGVMYQKI